MSLGEYLLCDGAQAAEAAAAAQHGSRASAVIAIIGLIGASDGRRGLRVYTRVSMACVLRMYKTSLCRTLQSSQRATKAAAAPHGSRASTLYASPDLLGA